MTSSTCARRRVPLAVAILLVLTVLAVAPSIPAARAQLARLPQVAVFDFENFADPEDRILARQATDALVTELTRSGKWDVIPREQLLRQIDELGVASPLDRIALQKVGQALGADYVATGAVVKLTREGAKSASPGRVRATLAVALNDVNSGESANGAIETGLSRTPSPREEDLTDQNRVLSAVENAAFLAARSINNYTLPAATVLISRGQDEVTLNQGSRGGLRPGQEMVIFRGRERVGRVRVTSVESDSAQAIVTDPGKGIRPEDRARVIFSFNDLDR